MIQKKKIAILMSVYNGEKYISEQLDSLYNQTVIEDIRLFVRDDGSSDSTLNIINRWKDRIDIVVYKETNVGPARSFWELLNKDIEAEYFLFCDQDDIWDTNKVEKSIEALNQGCCLSYCNCRHIDSFGNIMQQKRVIGTPDSSYENLFISGITQGCSMCFTKDLKRFIQSKTIHCIPMHDVIVMLYAKAFGEIAWIDTPLFSYRIHNNNVVAKNRNIYSRIKKTLWNWKNSRNNSMAEVAEELINNIPGLQTNEFLSNMKIYKNNFAAKIKILRNDKLKYVSSDCKRSYIFRIILNWL